MPSRSLRTSYKICTPWLGSPTSYASGYMRHQRTSALSQSLTTELSSPPTYWIGFCTRGRSGSRRGNSDSMGMRKDLRHSAVQAADPARSWTVHHFGESTSLTASRDRMKSTFTPDLSTEGAVHVSRVRVKG